jgi:beta-1,4-N-acetylglucosaminyltransferase
MNIEFQVSNGKYVPVNHKYYKFMDQSAIETKYKEADIIITHVGAGTIYKLLELGKKFIVVPNLERIDKHQRDIADYISREKYAFVAYNFNQLSIFIF